MTFTKTGRYSLEINSCKVQPTHSSDTRPNTGNYIYHASNPRKLHLPVITTSSHGDTLDQVPPLTRKTYVMSVWIYIYTVDVLLWLGRKNPTLLQQHLSAHTVQGIIFEGVAKRGCCYVKEVCVCDCVCVREKLCVCLGVCDCVVYLPPIKNSQHALWALQ